MRSSQREAGERKRRELPERIDEVGGTWRLHHLVAATQLLKKTRAHIFADCCQNTNELKCKKCLSDDGLLYRSSPMWEEGRG